MVESCAVDSWALLAWLQNEEPAASAVQDLLERAQRAALELYLSAINAGEVYSLLAKRRGPAVASSFHTRLPAMPIRLHLPKESDIWEAAALKSRHAISYADAFAAALALSRNCPLLTGDREFRQIPRLKLHWLP